MNDVLRGGTAGSRANPLEPFLRTQGFVVLDGGLATELEARGHDLRDPLWSARVLLEDPESVRAVARDYLEAGADCIATVTYQATVQGLAARGFRHAEALRQMERAVELAMEERDAFWAESANRVGRLRPLVAASVGPYGAYLADGSEYRGAYGLSRAELVDFHRERWHLLARAGADLMACETIPSAVEAEALLRLLDESGSGTWAWISFSCPDGARISDGTPIEAVARMCDGAPGVAAVGINCTAPEHIGPLVEAMRPETDLPLLVYPNAGEDYDPVTGGWVGGTGEAWWEQRVEGWAAAGVAGVGGCCRIGPREITTIRRRLSEVAEARLPTP